MGCDIDTILCNHGNIMTSSPYTCLKCYDEANAQGLVKQRKYPRNKDITNALGQEEIDITELVRRVQDAEPECDVQSIKSKALMMINTDQLILTTEWKIKAKQ